MTLNKKICIIFGTITTLILSAYFFAKHESYENKYREKILTYLEQEIKQNNETAKKQFGKLAKINVAKIDDLKYKSCEDFKLQSRDGLKCIYDLSMTTFRGKENKEATFFIDEKENLVLLSNQITSITK